MKLDWKDFCAGESHFPLTGWQYFTKKVLTDTVETSDVGQDRQTTTSEDRATELLICKKLSLATLCTSIQKHDSVFHRPICSCEVQT